MKIVKLTKKQIEKIKKLKKEGKRNCDLARHFNVTSQTIRYHVVENCKRATIESAEKRWKGLSKKEKRKRYRKYRDPKYFMNRYRTDPQFRKKIIKAQADLQLRRRKKGLCYCGKITDKNIKTDKKYKTCKRCRKLSQEKRGKKNI